MVSVCTGLLRGNRSCEHFGGYNTINRIPLPLPLPFMYELKLGNPFGNIYLTAYGHIMLYSSVHEHS